MSIHSVEGTPFFFITTSKCCLEVGTYTEAVGFNLCREGCGFSVLGRFFGITRR